MGPPSASAPADRDGRAGREREHRCRPAAVEADGQAAVTVQQHERLARGGVAGPGAAEVWLNLSGGVWCGCYPPRQTPANRL